MGPGLARLLELARQAHRTELSEERRQEIRERVLARVERLEVRRRRLRALIAGGAAVLVAGVMSLLVRRALLQRS